MSETPVHAAHEPGEDEPGADPWAAFGYLVAGVLFYGAIGWAVSIWLHAAYWIPIGIVVGAGLGMYMVYVRFAIHSPKGSQPEAEHSAQASVHRPEPTRPAPPDDKDRGETE